MSEHYLTKYGTTTCPVERVRAEVDDDGDCSACGSSDIVSKETTEHAAQKLAEMRDLRGISTTEHEETP